MQVPSLAICYSPQSGPINKDSDDFLFFVIVTMNKEITWSFGSCTKVYIVQKGAKTWNKLDFIEPYMYPKTFRRNDPIKFGGSYDCSKI